MSVSRIINDPRVQKLLEKSTLEGLMVLYFKKGVRKQRNGGNGECDYSNGWNNNTNKCWQLQRVFSDGAHIYTRSINDMAPHLKSFLVQTSVPASPNSVLAALINGRRWTYSELGNESSCSLIECSITPQEDNSNNLNEDFERLYVHESKFLIVPRCPGFSQIIYISRIDFKGRSSRWYELVYAEMLVRQMQRLTQKKKTQKLCAIILFFEFIFLVVNMSLSKDTRVSSNINIHDPRVQKLLEKSTLEGLMVLYFKKVYGNKEMEEMENALKNALGKYKNKQKIFEVFYTLYSECLQNISAAPYKQ
uniref:MIR domain-containing protein n=1 Tax=Meloidogyne hapla TaxID=6305 RepID=A0A1I8BRY1_MELHA